MPEAKLENHIFDPAETMPPAERRALQLQRLRETVARVANVPFYKEAFARDGIRPESIASLEDLRRLPFTTKADLRNHYPLGFLAVLGAIGGRAGGANVLRAAVRVTFWGALAMALTAGIGKLFGTIV